MIKTRCYTNLDSFKKCEWAESLPAVPSVGQRMRSRTGPELRIVGLTWDFDGALVIELHKGGFS